MWMRRPARARSGDGQASGWVRFVLFDSVFLLFLVLSTMTTDDDIRGFNTRTWRLFACRYAVVL